MFHRRSEDLPDVFCKERIENADAMDNKSLLAAVKDHACSNTFKSQRLKMLQAFHEFHGKSPGGLNFHGREFAFFPYQQVDFVAARVAEEIYLRPYSLVERTLDNLGNHEVLIQIAAQGIAERLFLRVNAQQKSGEPYVSEVYLGGLDDTLSDVLEERRQFKHDICRLQHAQPVPDGRAGHAHIV